MIVRVDVEKSEVALEEPEVLDRFHVASSGSLEAIVRALGEHGRAASEADHVYVRIDSLRALAAGHVSAAWESRFDGMIAYATKKGWVDQAGTHVMAHVERA